MTCEEFQETTSTSAEVATTALLAAVCRHYQMCAPCRENLDFVTRVQEARISDSEDAAMEVRAKKIADRMFADEEARAVFLDTRQ